MTTITNAAVFFTAVFLIACSLLIFVATIIIINNMIHRYWKNLGWTAFANTYYRLEEPKLEKKDVV